METKKTLTLTIKKIPESNQPQVDEKTQSQVEWTKFTIEKIYTNIYNFLKDKGYKPRQEVDETKMDIFLVCWYLGDVVWTCYEGKGETVRTVRKLVQKKLGINSIFCKRQQQKIYWFYDSYITRKHFETLITICMKGIDKARKKAVEVV